MKKLAAIATEAAAIGIIVTLAVWLAWFLYGCKIADKADLTIPFKPVHNEAGAGGDTTQSSGRDSWSFAPSLTLSDASIGLAGVGVATALVTWLRGRRSTKALDLLVREVEWASEKPDAPARSVKAAMQLTTQRAGLAPWFHRFVQRRTRKPVRK